MQTYDALAPSHCCLAHPFKSVQTEGFQLTLEKRVKANDRCHTLIMMHWRRMALQPASTYKLKVKLTNQELALCSVHERGVHFIQTQMLKGDAGTEQAWSQHRQVCRTYTVTVLC